MFFSFDYVVEAGLAPAQVPYQAYPAANYSPSGGRHPARDVHKSRQALRSLDEHRLARLGIGAEMLRIDD
jgi:hypothetical protein